MKKILFIALAFIVTLSFSQQNKDPFDSGGELINAQKRYDVKHYNLFVDVDPEKKYIKGRNIISLRTTAMTSNSFVFNLDTCLEVTNIRYLYKKKKNKWKKVSFERKQGQIWITFDKVAFTSGIDMKFEISYEGQPRIAEKPPWLGGFSWSKTEDGKPWVAVSCQINGADLWFPCKDHQSDKADSMSISISVPKGLSAVSNGLLSSQINTKDKSIFNWSTRYPISNYNITMNIGPFEKYTDEFISTTGKIFPIEFYSLLSSEQESKDLLEQFSNMISFMEETGGAYPFQNEKAAFVNTPYGGMEHQTIISLGTKDRKNSGGYNYILFHELAHEWFGNKLTAKNWGNLFLQEGLATYFEILYHEYTKGYQSIKGFKMGESEVKAYNVRVKSQMKAAKNNKPMVSMGDESAQEFYFSDTDYFEKGVGFLHVLRKQMGYEKFILGVQHYVSSNSPKQLLTIHDFQRSIEEAAGYSLNHFFQVYCFQAQLPQLKVKVMLDSVEFSWNNAKLPLEVSYKNQVYILDLSQGPKALAIKYRDSFEIDPNFKLYMDTPEFIHQPFEEEDEMLKHMIGQMIIVGVKGNKPKQDPALLEDIKAGRVGGVVLYEKNIDKHNPIDGFKELITSLHTASEVLPFLVSIDQEGGMVNRLKTKYGYPKSVTASFLGDLNNLDSTQRYASITANECAKLGINVNFAPVLDLCKNKENPIIAKYGRCYSDDPEIVALHGIATVKGHHEHNVMTVVKHFPGHGSSHDDTHEGMANVTNYWGEEELIPFKRLIEEGYCDGVMTAHIINYKLNPDSLPATLSTKVNKEILRGQLGFQGVIFSDDMQMKAISKNYGLTEAIYLAIKADVDFLMFSNNINGVSNQTVDQVNGIIFELVKQDRISYKRIEESYNRILNYKNGFSDIKMEQ